MTDLLFTPEQAAHAASLTGAFIDRYLQTVDQRPVFPIVDRDALRAIMDAPLPELGTSVDTLFAELDSVVVPNSTHTAHPRFLSYVMPSPNGLSPYAEAATAALNQNCGLWPVAPAATAIEQTVTRWFADLFGFGQAAGGLIVSGGSMANMVGLTAARDWFLGESARTDGLQGRSSPLTLYTSTEVHSSIDKAVSMLGLGTKHLRRIPCDAQFRMRLDLLEAAVAADREAGLSPCCVIATAGTVMTGAIDPIADIAAFCKREGLWLHVDGAYGALTALSDRYRESLSAVSLADSVSLDPHKFLFTSFEAGCVLVKDRATLRHAFHVAPSYLAIHEDPDFINYSDHGPQLSRGFKALKVWWSLRHFGRKAYGATIDGLFDLASYMGQLASEQPEFELLAPVVYNCVCFRLRDLSDAQNQRVLARLVEGGTAFLGPARVYGVSGFRACFMSLRTSSADVDIIMREISRLGRVVRAEDGAQQASVR